MSHIVVVTSNAHSSDGGSVTSSLVQKSLPRTMMALTGVVMNLHRVVTISTIFLFLTAPLSSSQVAIRAFDSPFYQVPFLPLNVTVFKIARDDFNPANEQFIIGCRNYVLAINSSLSVIKSLKNGPTDDNPSCKPTKECPSLMSTDSDNHVILIDYGTKPYPSVIACGTVSQGMCRLMHYENFEATLGYYGSPEDVTNYVASYKKTISVTVTDATSSEKTIFIIGHEYDNRNLDLSPPLLTARRFDGKNKPSFTYSHSENTNSSIDVRRDLKRSYPVNWIYGFHDEKYIYVISNQKISRSSNEYSARIGRICRNDPTLRSYTEIPLECQSDEKPSNHKLATAAFFGSLGSNLATRLQERSDSPYLFIAMSAPSSELRVKRTQGSLICGISTSQLGELYRETAELCFLGDNSLTGLHDAFSKSDNNLCTLHRIGGENCGQSSFNEYIVRKKSVPLKSIFTVPKATVTSMISYSEKASTIALLGTDSGEIMKVALDFKSQVLYQQAFYSTASSYNYNRQVRPEPVLNKDASEAYFAVTDRVVKFPTKSCKIYSTCSSCMQTPDPLGCGWCGTYCASSSECITKPVRHCTPVIYSFFPKSGPVDGGTDLVISGDNFGSRTTQPHLNYIKLVNTFRPQEKHDCSVNTWSNNEIRCTTSSGTHMSDSKIQVHAQDNRYEYGISGDYISNDSFIFIEPTVTNIGPKLGPRFGGVNISVDGINLDIGSSRQVIIVDDNGQPIGCNITSVSEKRITCDTLTYTGSAQKGKFKVQIDRKVIDPNINFLFAPDPIITQIHPIHMTIASNSFINVTGFNLNSTADPRIKIEGIEYPCRVLSSQNMTCDQRFSDNLPLGTPLPVSFTNGGNAIKNQPKNLNITIHPEPKFHSFSTSEILFPDEPLLDIRGENLTTLLDIQIKVGDNECKIKPELSEKNRIKCLVISDKPLKANQSLTVSYALGKMSETLGRVYVKAKPYIPNHSSFLHIVLPVVLVVILFLCIALFYIRCKFKEAKDKKAKEAASVAFTNRPIRNDGYLDQNGDETDSYQPLNSSSVSTWDDDIIAEFSSRSKLIAQEHLHIDHEIGSGNFGSVYEGRLLIGDNNVPVAVKTPRRLDGPQELRTFLDEALTMRDLDHANVITLIGLVFLEKNKPGLVLPYMCNGDVLTYVRDSRRNPRIRDFINFQLDIARGMEYLALQKFVHRDLAARNCMLDENLRVHVADFGLSKDIYEKGYYKPKSNTALPVRWMAPESIKFSSFTEKSDVWSFGVTGWEICTRGVIPYPGLQNQQLEEHLKMGHRLNHPDQCPLAIYNIWLDCWSYEAAPRPSFTQVRERIEEFLEQNLRGEGAAFLNATYGNLTSHSYYNTEINSQSAFQPQKGTNFITKVKGTPPPLPPYRTSQLT